MSTNVLTKPAKKAVKSVKPVKKSTPTSFYLRVFSRHPSTKEVKDKILIKGVKAVYRHGSTTSSDNFDYEINSVESVKTSADKKLMKEAFDKAEIRHAPWIALTKSKSDPKAWKDFLDKLKFDADKDMWLIVKSRYGSRGTGNTLVKTKAELDKLLKEKTAHLDNYIVEEYKTYSVEYRIHVSESGYFYTCRKMLKKDTPKEERFQRHDDNCSWYVESNPEFNKPANWDAIVGDCVKALKVMEADVLAFDVKCTSIKETKDKVCRYIIIESCSAPAFGEITGQKYREELPKIIYKKYKI